MASVGDKVKITIEGTVKDTYNYDGCMMVYDGYNNHYIYDNSPAVELKIISPPHEAGHFYIDADGDKFIYGGDDSDYETRWVEIIETDDTKILSPRICNYPNEPLREITYKEFIGD